MGWDVNQCDGMECNGKGESKNVEVDMDGD